MTTKGHFAVARVYDNGRKPDVVLRGLVEYQAKREAGRMRDEMTDSQVGQSLDEGWTYAAVPLYGATIGIR